MIPDAGSRMLMSVIRKKIRPVSTVYSDAWHAYRMLDISEFRHERINHATRFSEGRNHISGIENFWSQAKRRLVILANVLLRND
ncbi:transposase, partial [Komagataeibacter europaeus]|uniref:transposase n=2 Tax=Acetobacteraceae TaxID=433 RepID=UPI0035A23538